MEAISLRIAAHSECSYMLMKQKAPNNIDPKVFAELKQFAESNAVSLVIFVCLKNVCSMMLPFLHDYSPFAKIKI